MVQIYIYKSCSRKFRKFSNNSLHLEPILRPRISTEAGPVLLSRLLEVGARTSRKRRKEGAREENEPERTTRIQRWKELKVLSNLPKCSIEELSQTFLSDGGFNYLPSFASLYIFLYARFSTVVGTVVKNIVQTET